MPLRLILWVSWICFLLFGCSAGLPAVKGYGYPHKGDSQNIGDDGDDDVLMSLSSDRSDWQPSNTQPASSVYTSYKPSVTQRPGSPPSRQTLPNAPEMEQLVNGASREWGLNNRDYNYQPRDPAKPQLGLVRPPSTSLGVASTNRKPASPAGGSTLYPGQTAYNKPSPSPSFHSWQSQPAGSGSSVADYTNQDAGSSGNIVHLVYEKVFQYPSENTGPSSNTAGESSRANYMSRGSSTLSTRGRLFPSNRTNTGARPAYPSGMRDIWSRFFGQTGYRPHHEKPSMHRQKPVASPQKALVRQRVSEPILLPPAPLRYRFKSKSTYRKGRYHFSQSRYSPLFPTSVPVSSGVKSQPAAPKGLKNPQRTK